MEDNKQFIESLQSFSRISYIDKWNFLLDVLDDRLSYDEINYFKGYMQGVTDSSICSDKFLCGDLFLKHLLDRLGYKG